MINCVSGGYMNENTSKTPILLLSGDMLWMHIHSYFLEGVWQSFQIALCMHGKWTRHKVHSTIPQKTAQHTLLVYSMRMTIAYGVAFWVMEIWTQPCAVIQCRYAFTMYTDLNECQLDRPGGRVCDVNAVCSNLFGSFRCTCKTGYSGSGTAGSCEGKHYAWKKLKTLSAKKKRC